MNYKPLSYYADIIVGFAFPSKAFNENEDGIRLVRGKNVSNRCLKWGGESRWWSNVDGYERYLLCKDDILIGMDGSRVGKNYVRIREEDLPLLLVQRVACIRAKENVNTQFLWNCIANSHFEQYVDSIKTGSAIPHISAQQIGAYLVPVFDMDTQNSIGRLLGALDEKIYVNTVINQNLQAQARALYQHMIIDNADDSWTPGTLSDIALITMGQSPKGASYNEDGVGTVFFQGRAEFGFRFPSRRLYTTDPKRMAWENDALMSVRAPVGDMNVAYEDCCIGRGLGAIRTKDGHQSFVFYTMLALREQLNVFNGEGTVFGSINRDALNTMPVDIPPQKIMEKFENIVAPMDVAIRNNHDEICRLQALRDSLLPRLISGEMDVSKLEL